MHKDNELKNIIKSIFEARFLKRIKRSGTSILLGPELSESIPEHTFYTTLWAIVLHSLDTTLDLEKILTMCIIHDLEEVRTGDLNQLNRLYFTQDPELKAFSDMWKGSALGKRLTKFHKERIESKTNEAKAANDSDVLAELIIEKEYYERGTKEAKEWMEFTTKRLRTDLGKKVAKVILKTRMSLWWEEIKNKIREEHGVKPKLYK